MGYLHDDTESKLKENQIKRVISGHSPHTDSPWIMKNKNEEGNTKITIITSDTS